MIKATYCSLLVTCALTLSVPACEHPHLDGILGSDNKSVLKVSIHTVFAEDHQTIMVTGTGFNSSNIAENSILIGKLTTQHPKIYIDSEGRMPETLITIPKALELGQSDISVGNITFAKALQSKPVRLTLMVWDRKEELPTIERYIRQFEKENPSIRVKINKISAPAQNDLSNLATSSDPGDLIYMSHEAFPEMMAQNYFLDLTQYWQRDDANNNFSDIYPKLAKLYSNTGKIFGVPKYFTTLVLYYNKDLFTKASLPYPSPNWSWTDFLKAAQKLSEMPEQDGKPQYGFAFDSWYGQWLPWLWQNNGEIFDPVMGRWLMNDSAFIKSNAESFQFLADLGFKSKVSPAPSPTNNVDAIKLFMNGQAAMCISGRWTCMDLRGVQNFSWDLEVLPHKETRATLLLSTGYGIAAKTLHPEAAWQLVKYLTGDSVENSIAEEGLAVPCRKTIAESTRFLNAAAIGTPLNAQSFISQLDFARPAPFHKNWPQKRKELTQMVKLILSNENAPALETLQKYFSPEKPKEETTLPPQ